MFSQHARQRMQQRGISSDAVELLLTYGRSNYHRGREVVFFDRRAWQALQNSGEISGTECDRLRRHYLVLDDGAVVTVGHQYCHFKRDRH